MWKQWKWWLIIFSGSKITADSDCNHEIKRCLLPGIKVMTNLGSILMCFASLALAADSLHCAHWEARSLIIMFKLLCIIYKTFFFLFSCKTHFLCFFLLKKVIKRMWPAGWLLSWAWAIRGSSSPFTTLGMYGQSFTMTLHWEGNVLFRYLDKTCDWTQWRRLYKLLRFWLGRCSNPLVLQQHKTLLIWILLLNKPATYKSGMSCIFFSLSLPSA